jgi:hypothetical protein
MEETSKTPETQKPNKDEVALELMKFIATSTGYGKGSASGVGFTGKGVKTPEEQADSLIDLFKRCREVVHEK